MQSGRLAETVIIGLYLARHKGLINPNSIMRRDFDQPLPSLHMENRRPRTKTAVFYPSIDVPKGSVTPDPTFVGPDVLGLRS